MKIQLLSAIVLLMIPALVYAQTSQIIILTDKQSYNAGDTISISGTISPLGASNSAVLQVYNTFNVMIQIGTVSLAPDGSFSTKIKTQGQSWANDGSYEIKILYVSTPILATATKNIDFKAAPPQPSSPPTGTQSSSPSQTQSSTPQSTTTTTNTQNNTQTVTQPQIPIEEQIKQRIALANKLKQELDQNTNTSQTNSQGIPFWVKDTARQWNDGTLDNAGISKVIEYFISNGLVTTNAQIKPTDSFEHTPFWLREVSGWWSQGIVSDNEYVNLIQFLLYHEIIRQ